MMHDFNFSFSEKCSMCLFSVPFVEPHFPVTNTEVFLRINPYQFCAVRDFSPRGFVNSSFYVLPHIFS